MKDEVLVLQGRASVASEDTPKVTVALPASFQEACDVWGEDAAERLFASAVKEALARFAKARFAAGMDVAELEAGLVGWQPGVRANRAKERAPAKVSRTLRSLAKLSDEEIAALRSKLQEDPRFAIALAGSEAASA